MIAERVCQAQDVCFVNTIRLAERVCQAYNKVVVWYSRNTIRLPARLC